MQIYNSSKGYGAIPQVAHWLTAGVSGVGKTSILQREFEPKVGK
jgi:hypothetical protein